MLVHAKSKQQTLSTTNAVYLTYFIGYHEPQRTFHKADVTKGLHFIYPAQCNNLSAILQQ